MNQHKFEIRAMPTVSADIRTRDEKCVAAPLGVFGQDGGIYLPARQAIRRYCRENQRNHKDRRAGLCRKTTVLTGADQKPTLRAHSWLASSIVSALRGYLDDRVGGGVVAFTARFAAEAPHPMLALQSVHPRNGEVTQTSPRCVRLSVADRCVLGEKVCVKPNLAHESAGYSL